MATTIWLCLVWGFIALNFQFTVDFYYLNNFLTYDETRIKYSLCCGVAGFIKL